MRLASATVLIALAMRGLLAQPRPPPVITSTPATAEPPAGGRELFARFAVLTLINPLTALYFTALAAGHSRRPAEDDTLLQGSFLAGVFIASLAWQLILVAAGAIAGARIPVAAHTWTYRVAYGLVVAYALRLALPLP
jgi:threonine/homoserine/homoserine lactone efflux protein